MSIDADALGPGRLDIARVFQRTFDVLGRNFATFFILALIMVGLPAALTGMLQLGGLSTGAIPRVNTGVAFSGLIGLVTNAILQGALIYGTVRDLNGERPAVVESLATGLRAFLPLIGLSILLGIAIVFGLILLIVPGVMMACAWCVAIPSLVAENRRVFECFERSADLTRGNRWMIFALFVIYMIAYILVGSVIVALTGISTVITSAFLSFNPFAVLANALVETVAGVIGSTGIAVLYVELRQGREGAGSEWLRDIFA
jgi:uncharacterized membrane protein